MGKNGSRLISLRQYRVGDLFLFAVIAVIAELVCWFSSEWFPDDAWYTLSLFLPLVTIVIARWGWQGVVLAALEGAFYCAIRGVGWQNYIIFIIGNAAIGIELLLIKVIGKKRFTEKWYWPFLTVLAGWACVNLVRSVITIIFSGNAATWFGYYFGLSDNGLLAIVIGEVVIMVCRRLDGMIEDQKQYLLRLDKERKEKAYRDTYGDEPIEIDEESFSILNKKDGDGF